MTLPDTFRASVLIWEGSLSDAKKREWREIMLCLGDRHGVPCAAHPANKPREDGKAHVITYSMNDTPTKAKAVTKLAAESGYTEEQIDSNLTFIDFPGATPEARLAALKAWTKDPVRKAVWHYDEYPAWMVEPPEEVMFEDPEGPFEISYPIEWVVVPEE